MDTRTKQYVAILASLLLTVPLVAHAIQETRKEEAKLETIAPTEKPATTTPAKIADTKGEVTAGNSGTASWYDYDLDGAPGYSREFPTAASRDYPRGTILRVTNTKTGAFVDVRVNDYGPEAWTGREVDLSSFAFSKIGNLRDGLAHVVVVELPDEK